MEKTENFNLNKPAPEDFYNVEDTNDNMDIIDAEIKIAQDKAEMALGEAGNPTTVNGHTIESDVPANAKFTDTIYTHPDTHPASMITGLQKFQFQTEIPSNLENNTICYVYE